MPRDKTDAHKRVLAAARDEFMEYGFEKASMRRVGERCGMTAAGIYRHCRDKADLFAELVKPSAEKVYQWLEAHIDRSAASMETGSFDLRSDSAAQMMRQLIYPNMDEYRLLLTKAQGTEYESFLRDLTEKYKARMLDSIPMLREKGLAVREIDPQELYILLSAYTAAMFEPVVQGYSPKQALRCLDTLEAFFLPGWKQIMGL